MPAYISSPFAQRVSLLPGQVGYSLGKLDTHNPGARMSIQNVAITSNVATLYVTLLEGYIPIVGALISVMGTQTVTSGGAPNFNVTNIALSAVTIDSTTGIGTVTFALTSNNITKIADSGMALVPTPEIGDTLTAASAIQTGQQFALPKTTSADAQAKNIQWSYSFPSAPASASIQLMGSMLDILTEYSVIDAVSTGIVAAGGESRTINSPENWNFLLIQVTVASGGTLPTVLAKIGI